MNIQKYVMKLKIHNPIFYVVILPGTLMTKSLTYLTSTLVYSREYLYTY